MEVWSADASEEGQEVEQATAINASSLGFCLERLGRIETRYAAGVEAGEIPGAVIVVLREGRPVYRKAIGFAERAAGRPLTIDTMFWLASMTKPITSVAVMMLVEQGLVDLNRPVAAYLPALADCEIAATLADGTSGYRIAARQPTVHDLLRHTAGFVYGEFGDSAVHKDYLAANLFDRTKSTTLFLDQLAKLPLAHEPGSTFEYSIATDVLGCVVEAVSGIRLDRFVADRITLPLGMTSTGFCLPDGAPFAWSDGVLAGPEHDALDTAIRTAPAMISGGAGLYGTAVDYACFAQMLLNGGEFGGVRLLAPMTVAHMTANHLPDAVPLAPHIADMLNVIGPDAAIGQGFGLGFAIRTDPGLHPAPGSVGDFYWAGAGGTYFWVDPVQRLVAVVLTAQPQYDLKVRYRQLARAMIYQALVQPYDDQRSPRAGARHAPLAAPQTVPLSGVPKFASSAFMP